MESQVRHITSDREYYVKSYHLFSALCGKVSVYAHWVDSVFNDAVASKIKATLSEQEELRVLGIGSGSGKYTKRRIITIRIYKT